MSIEQIIARRGIASVLHFTTNKGTLGILASRALKSRLRLNDDQQLKHIFQPNAESRNKDAAWLDYVNLSLTEINTQFFEVCSGSWHREKDFWWCILAFSPEVLMHDGVWFTTTNNIYTGVRRGAGAESLEAMFAPEIIQWRGRTIERTPGLVPSMPTCSQAEVLYPGEISTNYLQVMHVSDDNFADELAAQMAAVGHPNVAIQVTPKLFRHIR